MAGHTIHAAFAKVDITGYFLVFTGVLIANSGTMTGGTGSGHRRCFYHIMTIQKTATNTVRLADVAITTSGMAGNTIITESFVKGSVIFRQTA
jgi:hypothetical protein